MKILELDIETAPHKVYTWGLFNQNISIDQIDEPGYILCWAAKWYGKKDVMFCSMPKDGEEKMLKVMYDLIDEADVVLHFNGTTFDMPWLMGRFLKMGWPPPSPVQQLDLLKAVRRRFRLASNKLDYILRYLDLGSKVEHEGFKLWKRCMDGDGAAWKRMEMYNKGDVLQMEKVYEKVKPWISTHPNYALYQETEGMVCPNCGGTHLQKRGSYVTTTMTYQRYQCQTCFSWSKDRQNNVPKDKKKDVLKGVA